MSTIELDLETVAMLDEACKREGLTREEMVEKILTEFIKENK